MPRIHYEELISRCKEEQLGVSVPVPLNRSITDLCDAVEQIGGLGAVSRKEMVGAILFAATSDTARSPSRLVPLLRRYRTAKAGERMPPSEGGKDYFDYEDLKPG